MAALTDPLLCQYAQMLTVIAGIRDEFPPIEALAHCPEEPTRGVRIEPGDGPIAVWIVAQVCAGHAAAAEESIRGCTGSWRLRPTATHT